MNRSVVREFPASGAAVTPGEVLVATAIGSPGSGGLACPAAPLAGALLERKGRPVRYAPVAHYDDPVHDEGGATMFVATCAGRDSATTGLATVAAASDPAGAAAARAAVRDWAAVFGTRRLLAAPGPWCPGAQQALDSARRTLADLGAVHILGQLAASPDEAAALSAGGAVFASGLDEVPDGATVLVPAHGVAAGERARARARGLDLVDATCPLVAATQAEAEKLAARGDDIVLIGPPGHPVAAAISGAAPGRVTTVSTPAGTAGVRVADSRRVSYLLQPGTPVAESVPLANALRSRFPAVRSPHPDGFCFAASDRAETVRALAADCEVVLVLGAPAAADTRQLAALARGRGTRAQVIAAVSDLTPAMFTGVTAAGLVESTSASADLARLVTEALSGLGPLSVRRRAVRTDMVSAPAC